MLITLNDIVDNSSSNKEGLKLYTLMDESVQKNNHIVIVIDSNSSLSSSFLNSSIGLFLEKYGLDYFKSKIKIKGSRSQFNRILDYIEKFNSIYSC